MTRMVSSRRREFSSGANGLADQNGNSYNGTVTASGVFFSQNGSGTSYSGQWINGSDPTSFTQSGGALNGFRFTFTQPNTATGQKLAGSFSFNGSLGDAQNALQNAGFSHSMLDQLINPLHGIGIHFRSEEDPDFARSSAHFIISVSELDPAGMYWRPPTSVNGDFHYGETDPRSLEGLYNHVVHEVIPYLTTPH